MELEYRKVIQNIQLTKEEAITLDKAEKILQEALDKIFHPECPYDKDLVEALNAGLDGLKKCYPRINVKTTIDPFVR